MVVVGDHGQLDVLLRLDVDDVEQQQRVVRGERAARFRDEIRHRDLELAAHFGERVHDIVRVLLHGVVHARRDRGARAVVVDAEPAADIDVADAHARRVQLRVEARDLLQPGLDVADVGDLGAEVEVDELEDLEAVGVAQLVDDSNELARAESELRLLAAALRPAPMALGGQLDAHARLRRHAHLVGNTQQHIELTFLLDDDEHLVAELLAHEGEAHELLVLVAVADDHVIRRFAEREHGLQLRLAAALDADAVRRAELHDLLDDVALLIDLDRVHEGVRSLVLELLYRAIGRRRTSVSMRERRMSLKRRSTGRPTPCSPRSIAMLKRSSLRSGRARSGQTTACPCSLMSK